MKAHPLSPFPYCRVRFTLEFTAEGSVPRFKGSALRGSFGHTLKEETCARREPAGCPTCRHPEQCAYGYLFETPTPPGASWILRDQAGVPHPFVLHETMDASESVRPGTRLEVLLALFGRATHHFPVLVQTFEKMGQWGLGSQRVPFRLAAVTEASPGAHEAPLYDPVARTYSGTPLVGDLSGLGVPVEPCDAALEWVSPAQIKSKGRMSQAAELADLVPALARRLSALSVYHCGGTGEVPIKDWIALAREVRSEGEAPERQAWKRYSSRQGRSVPVEGMTGRRRFLGVPPELAALLRMGEIAHVGKGTSFGMGRYRLQLLPRDTIAASGSR